MQTATTPISTNFTPAEWARHDNARIMRDAEKMKQSIYQVDVCDHGEQKPCSSKKLCPTCTLELCIQTIIDALPNQLSGIYRVVAIDLINALEDAGYTITKS